MKAKKVRRLSMDLTKDRGGHVKVLDRSPVPYPDEIKWGFPDTPYVPVGQ